MATYIEDDETSRLIEEYAAAQSKTKTGALRDLLRRELKALNAANSAEERYANLIAFVSSQPTEEHPVSEQDIDSLYTYLDSDVD